MKVPHVVIVGGGFGGLSAAKILARKNVRVTLVDKKNYHLFQPLLYQVAMAAVSPAEIAYPLRSLLSRYANIEVLLGEVREVNKEQKWIETDSNKVEFDYLILACGSTYTYFNSPQWEPFAPGLKTIQQATEIRKRVFLALEKAERDRSHSPPSSLLTFVVVGGGPTGVELAGSLGEITRYTIKRDFKHIRPDQIKVILIEAGPRVLSTMPEALSNHASMQLKDLGVEILLNSKVTEVNDQGIQVADIFIESSTILWAAGVAANPLNRKLGVELDSQGRVIISKDLSVPGFPDIFVIGDQANFQWGADKQPLPGLAPVAMQQGKFVARLIIRKEEHKPLPEVFTYKDKGQMATIGRSRAVALYKNIQMHGFVAWIGWLFIHIYYLIGFKNRIFVLFSWAWTYITFQRGARLIVEGPEPIKGPEGPSSKIHI